MDNFITDLKATANSETISKEIAIAKTMNTKKGIAFYCSRRHEFMFVENSKDQTTEYLALKQPKKNGKPNNAITGPNKSSSSS